MRERAWGLTLTSVVLALVLVACANAAVEEGDEREEEISQVGELETEDEAAEVTAIGDADDGRRLFNTGGAAGTACNTCHTLDGSVLVGPSLLGIAERADERVPDLSAVEYLYQSIVEPDAYLVAEYDDLMPDIYGEALSEDDIGDLIAFMLTQ